MRYHNNYDTGDPYYRYNITENMARVSYYGVTGTPTLRVDGTLVYVGMPTNPATYFSWIHTSITTRRGIASPCTIRVEASTAGTTVNATVWVTADPDSDMHNTNQRLFVALIHRCHYQSGYGTHWYPFRDMQPSTSGYSFTLDAGNTLEYSTSFATGAGWDLGDLRVIAFVQLINTTPPRAREILQSGYAEVATIPPLVINEFMAYNVSAVQDPAGDYDDWIEIYNAGERDQPLLGKALTNQCSDPDKWVFPDTTLPAGGHLVVWCDNELAEPGLHANFTLTNTADTLVMYDNLATCYLQIDRKIYPAQSQDVSLGRLCDGMPTWVQFTTPTPGTANSGCADSVQNLAVLVEGNSLHLFWQAYPWATGYTVYRHDVWPFEPKQADSIGAATDTSFVDTDILLTLPSAFYRIKARL